MTPEQIRAFDEIRSRLAMCKASCVLNRDKMKGDQDLLHHIDIIADDLQDLMIGIDVQVEKTHPTDGTLQS